jgi:hypothetical protein
VEEFQSLKPGMTKMLIRDDDDDDDDDDDVIGDN